MGCVWLGEPFEDACDDIYTTLKDANNEWCEKMNVEQGERTVEDMMDFINEYEYDDDDSYFYIRQFTFEWLTYGGFHRYRWTTVVIDG